MIGIERSPPISATRLRRDPSHATHSSSTCRAVSSLHPTQWWHLASGRACSGLPTDDRNYAWGRIKLSLKFPLPQAKYYFFPLKKCFQVILQYLQSLCHCRSKPENGVFYYSTSNYLERADSKYFQGLHHI